MVNHTGFVRTPTTMNDKGLHYISFAELKSMVGRKFTIANSSTYPIYIYNAPFCNTACTPLSYPTFYEDTNVNVDVYPCKLNPYAPDHYRQYEAIENEIEQHQGSVRNVYTRVKPNTSVTFEFTLRSCANQESLWRNRQTLWGRS